ncbi:MAG: DUF4230 domain-containing protein [Phycisphaerales bacterium]
MPIPDATLVLVLLALAGGAAAAWLLRGRLVRPAAAGPSVSVEVIAERVRAVGKLVGLEVCAKEIATASTGWNWLPPLLLSQARLAMIFNFEKQYVVDLTRVGQADITPLGPGRFRVVLPPVEGQLRLLDVTPYDIQNARVLGLLDVIPMTAERQRELMKRAQQEASDLFRANDARYLRDARQSIERHLRSLMDLFGIHVEIAWSADEPSAMPRLAIAAA